MLPEGLQKPFIGWEIIMIMEFKTIKAAIEVNDNQKLKLIKKARQYYSSLEGLTVAVLGLTFKPGTNESERSTFYYKRRDSSG